uniref:NACHT-associated inactive Restriction Endonuclease 2 domain-containing protein n=1 Tax=Candidatus Kentrum sp. LFY TaxID=2126342 RepID=A0A450UDD5_9GAMM|nr:MAG: hypothetical protein BECKLFY1418A_GA0070994_101137 [Candidatus Kentron sp. LFY]
MEIDRLKLDVLYKSYGFKIRKASSEDIRVYTYRSGYFNNADIISIDDSSNPSKDLEDYQKAGFACTIRDYKSLEDAEKELFNGFFAFKATKKRFRDEEERFRTRQSNIIGGGYQFVSPPYRETHKEIHKETQTEGIPLTDYLIKELEKNGPRLIILEAAAGYGKTCASFELLRKSLGYFSTRLPLFIELSRNRQAKIFRYVLLDEIDRIFPSLSASLVGSEIEKGNIFMIVDGFDELLHRTEAESPDYHKVDPMLETLSDLLKGNAKIVLTSRKTAIFSGDHFHTWMENHENDFHISRHSLLKPNLEDWLSYERRYALDKEKFPIEKISNPVLLAFLRGQKEDEFESLAKNPEKIVDEYFTRLLDRETERQELRMDIDEQYRLFTSLAAHMLELDFTAEDHEYLQLFISESNKDLLLRIRNRYPSEARPTLEELSAKLVSHALLDRKGDENDRVGFVNDFVLGNFIGNSLLKSGSNDMLVPDDFLEQTILSYRSRAKSDRLGLWEKLKFSLEFISSEARVSAEVALCGHPVNDLIGETFSRVTFDNINIGTNIKIDRCVFADCSFSNVTFQLDSLYQVTFVSCRFYSCSYVGGLEGRGDKDVHLVNCAGEENQFIEHLGRESDEKNENHLNDIDACKKTVLEQFWPIGRPNFQPKKQIITLYKGHAQKKRGLVSEAITELQHDGALIIKGETVEVSTSNMSLLRRLLGR